MRTKKFLSAATKIALVAVTLAFVAWTKHDSETDQASLSEETKQSSISMVNGNYKIDSNVIWKNSYKTRLLSELRKEQLVEKKNYSEIPEFIKEFLDYNTKGGKFEIADPNEEWCVGNITDFGSNNCKAIPDKKLTYFGVGKNMALFSFYCGGFRMSQIMVVLKFHDTYFQGKKVVDFYYNKSGAFVTTKDEIIKFLSQKPAANEGC